MSEGYVRMEVDSECFQSIGYNVKTEELELTFASGKTYVYSGVGPLVALEFSQADSLGTYYHKRLKGRYPERKVG